MQLGPHAALVLATILTPLSTPAQHPDPVPPPQNFTPAERYQQISEATALNRKGALPFHLKMDTQLHDLQGKPTETGTIEEWWAAPDEYRIEINSGSLHDAAASGHPDTIREDTRTSYLLNELLQQAVNPLGMFIGRKDIISVTRKFGQTNLECLRSLNLAQIPPELSDFCTEPGTDNLRVEDLHAEMIVRNTVGTFRNTHVALAIKIAYVHHDAISGKIVTLESFTPGQPGTPVLQKDRAETVSPTKSGVKLPGVVAGHVTNRVAPVYPQEAKDAHVSGTVLLHAIITREGRIRSLFVLASPDSLLSRAAVDAVRQWTYTPYLLNGQPAEVDTTIAVNFKLNP